MTSPKNAVRMNPGSALMFGESQLAGNERITSAGSGRTLGRGAELRRFTRILARPSDPREKRARPAESLQTRQQWSAELPQAELRRGPRSLAQIACCAADNFHPARKARQW